MRVLLSLLVAIACIGTATAQPLSREGFRDSYIAAITQAEPWAKAVPDPSDPAVVKVTRPDAEEFTAFLDNAYRDYLNDPSELDSVLDRHVRLGLGKSADFDAALVKDTLVLLPRSREILVQAAEYDFLHRPFVGDLIMVIMIDGKETLRYATKPDLEKLGLSTEAAFDIAASNVLTRVGRVDTENEAGIDVTGAESGLAPGLLFVPGFCAAGTPDRTFLVADRFYFFSVPSADASARAALARVLRGMTLDGASLSTTLIECKAGVWRAG
jgi:hypothetical protein